LLSVKARLTEYGDLASAQLFSSLKKDGLRELEVKLKHWLTDDSVFEDDTLNPQAPMQQDADCQVAPPTAP